MPSVNKELLLSAKAKDASKHKVDNRIKSEPVERHVIVHPRDAHLPHLSGARYSKTRVLNDKTSITFADITAEQAADLATHLVSIHGSIEKVSPRYIDFPFPVDTPNVELENKAVAATSSYPNAPINCPQITMSSDFVLFFADTMVNVKNFPKANLSIGNNYSGSTKPCNPHSDYTFSIFEQVLGDPKLQAINIPIFNCYGNTVNDSAINGFMDVLDYAKANPSKKVAVFCAISGGQQNQAETLVVQEIVAAGVLFGVSAGNTAANICNHNIPPWNVPGVMQIGGTSSPGNQGAYFTNWSDVTPNSQYGDCVNAYLPSIFTIKKFNVKEQGTSFAVPQGVAWVLRWWSENPSATAQQAIAAFNNHTTLITKQGIPSIPPNTPSGQMRVVTTADYCDTNVTASSTPRPS